MAGAIHEDKSEIISLCEELDASTDLIMSTVEQILQCQAQIGSCMKQGFLCMAKARYSLGVNRVSALQYNEESLGEASAHVQVTENSDTYQFSLLRGSQHEAPGADVTSIRHRRKNDEQALNTRMEDLTLDQTNDETAEKQNSHSNHTKSDPLKWFGVLVPQALRQSQRMFQQVTENCCQLATLKADLMKLRDRHDKLMHKKYELGPRVDEPNIDIELSDTDSVDSNHST